MTVNLFWLLRRSFCCPILFYLSSVSIEDFNMFTKVANLSFNNDNEESKFVFYLDRSKLDMSVFFIQKPRA